MKSTTTKLEVLLKTMEFKPMSYSEMKSFLFSLDNRKHGRTAYDSALYGTNFRFGVLEKFCQQTSSGRWKTVRPVVGPFTEKRPVAFQRTDRAY